MGKQKQSIHRATSYDVARAAGVSQSAVSRCFAPGGSIAAATRERVMKAAAELGYRPNALAQGLISGRTNLVAVIISSLTNRSYPEVLDELTQRLTARDMRVLLFALKGESEVDSILDQVWRHSVDGVISAARLSDAQIEVFAEHQIPVVLYNRQASAASAASVCCDSVAGERLLVSRLLAAGHRRFGIIAGARKPYVGEERRTAILARLTEAGIDVRMVRGDFSYASGGEGLRQLRAPDPDLDAVVSVNDAMAIGAIDVARHELGLEIPEDLSIVGFDGSGPATWLGYRLTSIRQPIGRMTEAAVSMLADLIDNPDVPAERRLFAGQLIVGKSARLGRARAGREITRDIRCIRMQKSLDSR